MMQLEEIIYVLISTTDYNIIQENIINVNNEIITMNNNNFSTSNFQ